MRTFHVEFEVELNSPDLSDWICESIVDQLDFDEGENLKYIKVSRVTDD
jgi:hypothetical protein